MLAALGPYTEQGIEIRDAAELRVKESDRIAALAENLKRMGAMMEERPDGLRVEGRSAGKTPRRRNRTPWRSPHSDGFCCSRTGGRRGNHYSRRRLCGSVVPNVLRGTSALVGSVSRTGIWISDIGDQISGNHTSLSQISLLGLLRRTFAVNSAAATLVRTLERILYNILASSSVHCRVGSSALFCV